MLKHFISALLILFFSFPDISFAQQDTLYTDTVIIIKKPHVIKKQVLTYDSVNITRNNIVTWNAGIYLMKGFSLLQSPAENVTFSKADILSGEVILSASLGNTTAGMGLGVSSGSFNATNHYPYNITFSYDSSFNRLLDSYKQIINGQEVIVQIIEEVDTVIHRTLGFTSDIVTETKFSYLQIPFVFSYRINLFNRKVYFIPGIHVIMSRLRSQSGYVNNNFRKVIWSYAVQLTLSYMVKKNISVNAFLQGQQSMQEIHNYGTISSRLKSYQYGTGITLHF